MNPGDLVALLIEDHLGDHMDVVYGIEPEGQLVGHVSGKTRGFLAGPVGE
jgi:hypothetical protein